MDEKPRHRRMRRRRSVGARPQAAALPVGSMMMSVSLPLRLPRPSARLPGSRHSARRVAAGMRHHSRDKSNFPEGNECDSARHSPRPPCRLRVRPSSGVTSTDGGRHSRPGWRRERRLHTGIRIGSEPAKCRDSKISDRKVNGGLARSVGSVPPAVGRIRDAPPPPPLKLIQRPEPRHGGRPRGSPERIRQARLPSRTGPAPAT